MTYRPLEPVVRHINRAGKTETIVRSSGWLFEYVYVANVLFNGSPYRRLTKTSPWIPNERMNTSNTEHKYIWHTGSSNSGLVGTSLNL